MLRLGLGAGQMVRLLLEKGADIHALTNRGKTALDLAKDEGHTGVVNILSVKLRQAKRR